jgi:hypothetical protein
MMSGEVYSTRLANSAALLVMLLALMTSDRMFVCLFVMGGRADPSEDIEGIVDAVFMLLRARLL